MPALPSPAVRAQSKAVAPAGPAAITAPSQVDPTAASAPSSAPAAPAPAPAAAPERAPAAFASVPASDVIPLAPQIKGSRPKSNPTVLPPAATRPPEGYADLIAPNPLSLPVKDSQVRIDQLRPLSLVEVETLAEVNNPTLKALASQVDQAQSELRSKIALWYPQLSVNANSLPTFDGGQQFRSGQLNNFGGSGYTTTGIWRMQAFLEASWALIDPTRTPQISAARDAFEQSKNEYLIGLRKLRLDAATAYFDLQSADDQVRIGQESVRASLISLRDARARFQAGVATKLEVLEAETQLARDQRDLTNFLAAQAIARRTLAALLDLPENVTPTAKDPSRVIGTWLPSLQESIVAAFAFREELDNVLLRISIANSNANTSLGQVQPFLKIINNFGVGRGSGYTNLAIADPGQTQWSVDNSVGMNLSWRLFDGGAARAQYRKQKQSAEENTYRFAERRDSIRQEVESSFYDLEKNNRNIITTSREVISARESLRLARLRFQAGVTTQREVVDTQRDLTQAEVRYSLAISDYNKRLAELRRRTGLDQIALCQPAALPPTKPRVEGASDVPVEPQSTRPACAAFVADPSRRPSP